MAFTKGHLIKALNDLDLPEDTLVVMAFGIGFEDVYDVTTQNIVSSKAGENQEIPAIVLH